LEAIRQVLQGQRFDEILLSTLPARLSRWLGMGLPSRERVGFDGPVTVIEAGGGGRSALVAMPTFDYGVHGAASARDRVDQRDAVRQIVECGDQLVVHGGDPAPPGARWRHHVEQGSDVLPARGRR
jgi:hypothetical protein